MRKSHLRTLALAAVLMVSLVGCSVAEPDASEPASEEGRSPELEIIDSTFAGPHGDVPIRIYRVAGTEPENGLLWLHGGAFMFGDLDMPESHWVAQQLAAADRVVVAADYRLAPVPEGLDPDAPATDGHFFPVAVEEVSALAEALISNDDIADADNWVIGGASAGGTLASGAAVKLRDEARVQPQGLVLAYPMTHADSPPFSQELAEKVAALPDEGPNPEQGIHDLALYYAGGDPVAVQSPYAFPGGHDLKGLPTTFIVNSDSDKLRASGEAFGSELAAAGVDVQVVREPDTIHGHINGPDNVGADKSIARIKDWLHSVENENRD